MSEAKYFSDCSITFGASQIEAINVGMAIIAKAFAMMAIPTLIASIWLAPKVIEQSEKYFASLKK